MCFYSRLQQQSTGGSLAPPPSQRLRRVHRATTDLLFPLHYIHVHIVISYSCNGEHDNPWCIIQCIILLACGRDLICMLLDTKSIMSVFFPIQGTILALRVFGPPGPASCMVLSLSEMEMSLGETSPLLSLPAVAQSQVIGLIRLHYFFMHPHAISSMSGFSVTFTHASMVYIHVQIPLYIMLMLCAR